jgi:hypothetical protein
MSAKRDRSSGWPVKAVAPPALTTAQWVFVAIPGLVLLVAAVMQLACRTLGCCRILYVALKYWV